MPKKRGALFEFLDEIAQTKRISVNSRTRSNTYSTKQDIKDFFADEIFQSSIKPKRGIGDLRQINQIFLSVINCGLNDEKDVFADPANKNSFEWI